VLQRAGPDAVFLIRTIGDPAAIAGAVRRAMKELEPARAVFGLTALEQHLDDAYRENGLRAGIVAGFSISAVLLALVGLYGTLSYLVGMRRREVGVRLAFGALRRQIIGRFLAQGLRVASPAWSGLVSRSCSDAFSPACCTVSRQPIRRRGPLSPRSSSGEPLSPRWCRR
jgi:putative ABC transport system permease protein